MSSTGKCVPQKNPLHSFGRLEATPSRVETAFEKKDVNLVQGLWVLGFVVPGWGRHGQYSHRIYTPFWGAGNCWKKQTENIAKSLGRECQSAGQTSVHCGGYPLTSGFAGTRGWVECHDLQRTGENKTKRQKSFFEAFFEIIWFPKPHWFANKVWELIQQWNKSDWNLSKKSIEEIRFFSVLFFWYSWIIIFHLQEKFTPLIFGCTLWREKCKNTSLLGNFRVFFCLYQLIFLCVSKTSLVCLSLLKK